MAFYFVLFVCAVAFLTVFTFLSFFLEWVRDLITITEFLFNLGDDLKKPLMNKDRVGQKEVKY